MEGIHTSPLCDNPEDVPTITDRDLDRRDVTDDIEAVAVLVAKDLTGAGDAPNPELQLNSRSLETDGTPEIEQTRQDIINQIDDNCIENQHTSQQCNGTNQEANLDEGKIFYSDSINQLPSNTISRDEGGDITQSDADGSMAELPHQEEPLVSPSSLERTEEIKPTSLPDTRDTVKGLLAVSEKSGSNISSNNENTNLSPAASTTLATEITPATRQLDASEEVAAGKIESMPPNSPTSDQTTNHNNPATTESEISDTNPNTISTAVDTLPTEEVHHSNAHDPPSPGGQANNCLANNNQAVVSQGEENGVECQVEDLPGVDGDESEARSPEVESVAVGHVEVTENKAEMFENTEVRGVDKVVAEEELEVESPLQNQEKEEVVSEENQSEISLAVVERTEGRKLVDEVGAESGAKSPEPEPGPEVQQEVEKMTEEGGTSPAVADGAETVGAAEKAGRDLADVDQITSDRSEPVPPEPQPASQELEEPVAEDGGAETSSPRAEEANHPAENPEEALLSELAAELGSSSADVSFDSPPNGLLIEEGKQKKLTLLEQATLLKRATQSEGDGQQTSTHNKELLSLKGLYTSKSKELAKSLEATNLLREELSQAQAITKAAQASTARIKQLESVLEQQKTENHAIKEKLHSHDTAAKRAISALQKEMATRVDQVKKMYENCLKEKDAAVVKYAGREKEVLDMQSAKEDMEKKLREQSKQTEAILAQIKQTKAEKAKLVNQAESHESEVAALQKEIDSQKEEISSHNIKVKWSQNKLKSELEAHKDTKARLAKTEAKLAQAKEETEQIRKNCQDMIKTYQESEEIKSNSLDLKLKAKEVALQKQGREMTDEQKLHQSTKKEMDSLKISLKETILEKETLNSKLKLLEKEFIQSTNMNSQFKEMLNNQKTENKALNKNLEELKGVKEFLAKEKEKVERMEEELATTHSTNSELETDIENGRKKQSELLQFTEKITAKNAGLLSENSSLTTRVGLLAKEKFDLSAQLENLTSKNSLMSTDLNEEKRMRSQENELLTVKLNEKSRAVEELTMQLEDERDHMKTIRRKHTANVKDLTRQLQQAHRKLDAIESVDISKDHLSSGSRTSSSSSLDALASNSATPTSPISIAAAPPSVTIKSGENSQLARAESTVDEYPEVNKAVLVERIVKLQKSQQRKIEKIEFMEDHVNQLIEEIKKKSKIIQAYVLREHSGALTPESMDVNKVQIAKQGGIMASLYRSHSADPNMNLDLSLEINHKLQAVLEDTLLKNITLKEGIDTLGDEIARLTAQVNGK